MDPGEFLTQVNFARYCGQPEGFYESFFQRANHPTRPLAFWIRYTLFSPKDHPAEAQGELWAVYFDGEKGLHLAFKQEFPIGECLFSPSSFDIRIGEALLRPQTLRGAIQSPKGAISWDLSFAGDQSPLLLLSPNLYTSKFPAAKSLVGLPMASYGGQLSVNGETVDVADWKGSQNHNWGTRHTDRYAWGQVAGFDTHPDSFLEVATAKLRFGPIWTPAVTVLVLRHQGREWALNGLFQALKARSEFGYFHWNFESQTQQVKISGEISAARGAFVGLNYRNPPGGVKTCLNTKIASCRLCIQDRNTNLVESLETESRAAFEILTDDRNHGIPITA